MVDHVGAFGGDGVGIALHGGDDGLDRLLAELLAGEGRAASQELKGVLGYTDSSNVSIDFNHDSHSSVFHMDQTKVIDGNFVRILSWYDNEWGFSNRMSDTAVAMSKLI